MFQFPGFASPAYEFSRRYRRSGGLPHSEIHGSKPARGSPWLIATCCVLHRLSVPRHPPDALQTLDLNSTNAPRAGESPQRNLPPARTASGKDASHDPTDLLPLPEGCPVGSSSVTNFFTCQRSHTRSRADICFLSHRISLAGSLKVTVRHLSSSPWWRQTGSNRRPHACKARALPTELCPRGGRWWAREDLNFRPHAYQARALTN
jgi:hypothetical protein